MSGLLIPFFYELKGHSNCQKNLNSNKSPTSTLFNTYLFHYKKAL